MEFLQSFITIVLFACATASVTELGQEFGADLNDLQQPHLVMFYAPWCGHCRALHPVWYELGNRLSRHPVTVGKLDATIYRSAAEKFNVKGFPSIRLIGSDRVLEYNGDRTTSSLFEFATKGSRPLFPIIGSPGKLRDIKRTEDVVFLAKGITEETRECLRLLATTIVHETVIAEVTNDAVVTVNKEAVAIKMDESTDMRPDMTISKVPGIIVSKDNKVFEFTGDTNDCFQLKEWVESERFAAFQVGSYPIIHPLLFLKRAIVFYYGTNEAKVRELQELAETIETLNESFYFIHVDKAEYIENLVSNYVEVDTVLIYNPVTELYSYAEGSGIKQALADLQSGRATLYGGTGVWANCKKVAYRLHSNVWPLFKNHPFIMGLVVILPIGLIAMCCCDEQRSKEDPIRQISEDESQMNLLWTKELVEAPALKEEVEDKDPKLKKAE